MNPCCFRVPLRRFTMSLCLVFHAEAPTAI
jgi:hypothetical protein